LKTFETASINCQGQIKLYLGTAESHSLNLENNQLYKLYFMSWTIWALIIETFTLNHWSIVTNSQLIIQTIARKLTNTEPFFHMFRVLTDLCQSNLSEDMSRE